MIPPEELRLAVDAKPDGVIIRFDVVPGASIAEVPSGFNQWRRSIEAKLTERPERGLANAQLEKILAHILNLPRERVGVVSGHKSHRKVVHVRGVDLDYTVLRLSQAKE
jgi:hypothetical protein